MGRAPCCEKEGLKKGPWTPDEDQILINYIRLHGHSNWRALPKLAGLLRCGKSCRLRWTNYLRPDIKLGNFTPQEEDSIIQLHHLLGNKWSAIAAKLPGRTDNEIKNVWHSHLKKRLPKPNTDGPISEPIRKRARKPKPTNNDTFLKYNITISNNNDKDDNKEVLTMCPQPSTSDMSTITSDTNKRDDVNEIFSDEFSDDFWSEVLSSEDLFVQYDHNNLMDQLTIESTATFDQFSSEFNGDDVNSFWFNLLTTSNDHELLPQIV